MDGEFNGLTSVFRAIVSVNVFNTGPSMNSTFRSFLEAFPPVPGETFGLDGSRLANQVKSSFQVTVPSILVDFWNAVGSGYFADREVYLFGENIEAAPRDSLIHWNEKSFWRDIYAPPAEGGPLFIGETCFGMQIGIRWERELAVGYLLDVDTMAAYKVAPSCEALLNGVMSDRYAFTEMTLLSSVRERFGLQPAGMHYAPIVSPLVGAQLTPDNHHLETPNVHLRTAIETFKLSRK